MFFMSRWFLCGSHCLFPSLGVAVNKTTADMEPVSFRHQPQTEPVDDPSLPTLDSVTPKIRQKQEQPAQSELPPASPTPAGENGEPTPATAETADGGLKSAEELEGEAGQEAAFNPETGEINWECPCLGGMAHGPCGEEFKAAFSCFVYSSEEPKGIECIDKFKSVFSPFLLLGGGKSLI